MSYNSTSLNPKHNPRRRRTRMGVGLHDGVDFTKAPDYKRSRIERWSLKPKLDARGRPIEGRFVPALGGRKVSKYDPNVEDVKHAKQGL